VAFARVWATAGNGNIARETELLQWRLALVLVMAPTCSRIFHHYLGFSALADRHEMELDLWKAACDREKVEMGAVVESSIAQSDNVCDFRKFCCLRHCWSEMRAATSSQPLDPVQDVALVLFSQPKARGRRGGRAGGSSDCLLFQKGGNALLPVVERWRGCRDD
jgi:hypothetical protein